MMDNVQKFLERRFSIISIIRVLSEFNFSNRELSYMWAVSRKVRSIYLDGGSISDENLYKQYVTAIEGDNLCSKESN